MNADKYATEIRMEIVLPYWNTSALLINGQISICWYVHSNTLFREFWTLQEFINADELGRLPYTEEQIKERVRLYYILSEKFQKKSTQ